MIKFNKRYTIIHTCGHKSRRKGCFGDPIPQKLLDEWASEPCAECWFLGKLLDNASNTNEEPIEPLVLSCVELLQQLIFDCAAELQYGIEPNNKIVKKLYRLANAKIKEVT